MSTQYPVLYDRPINKWKVAELKEELKRRNLMIKGLKDDLVRRLDEAIRNERANLEVQGQGDSHNIKETLGLDDVIRNESVNLEVQGQSDSHHIKEPMGVLNEKAGDTRKNDVNDVISDNCVTGLNIVEGNSQIDQGKVTGASVSNPSFIESGVIDDSDSTGNKMDKLLSGPFSSSEGVFGNSGSANEYSILRSEQEDNVGEAGNHGASGNLGASLENRGSLNEVAPGNEDIKNDVIETKNEEIEVASTASRDKSLDNFVTKLGNENIKPLQMDAESHVTHSSDQVYEISSNLGFQVQCESITTDTFSTFKETEIIENLNANNVQLEPEVVGPEMAQPSSHKDSSGDVGFYALDDKVPDVKQGLVVEADDKHNVKSSEKTYSADDVSVIDNIKENRAPDQVADDNELAQLSSAENKNLDDTVKSEVPLEHMYPPFEEKLDIAASIEPKESQDEKPSDAKLSELADMTDGEPLEKINLDHSSADLVVEADDKHNVKSSDKTYSADDVSVIDNIKENRTPDQVADDNVLAQLSSAENKNLDDTVKSEVPLEYMYPPFEDKLDIAASIEQKESQEEKPSGAKLSELVDMTDGEPLEKINLDHSSADDSMEDDAMETKHTDSDFNPSKVGDETKSTEEIIMKDGCVIEALQADLPVNISESSDATNDRIDLSSEKRKFEVEPALDIKETRKRLRRWNDENVKMPQQEGSDVSLYKVSVTTPSSHGNNPSSGGDSTNERFVPPSSKAPTNSLRIDNFLRPFTLKAVQELLSKAGTFSTFWMDHIKTHCYVTYSSVDEAIETRNAIYNLQWPANGGRLLIAEFVDPEEVKLRVEAPSQSVATLNSNSRVPSKPSATQAAPVNQQDTRQAASDVPTRREQLPRARSPVDEINDPPPIVTLDDLFRKTKATPRIYYLPLTDEQVAVKLTRQRK